MSEKELYNKMMESINKIENLHKENTNTLKTINNKLDELGILIMLDDVFNDLDEDEK